MSSVLSNGFTFHVSISKVSQSKEKDGFVPYVDTMINQVLLNQNYSKNWIKYINYRDNKIFLEF